MSSSTTDQKASSTVPGTSGPPVPPRPRLEIFLLFILTAGLLYIVFVLLDILKSQKQVVSDTYKNSASGGETPRG